VAPPSKEPLGILSEGVRSAAASTFNDVVVDYDSDLVEEDGVDLRQAIMKILAYRRLSDPKPLGGLPDGRVALDRIASLGPNTIGDVLTVPSTFAEQRDCQRHSSQSNLFRLTRIVNLLSWCNNFL
jgi:hypothetical protein